MITPDCSKLGALDFLIWTLFHFTWRKGGDGGVVIPVSPFPSSVIAQAFDTPNKTVCAG